MVPTPILVHVPPFHRTACNILGLAERLENRTCVALPASEVIHFGHPWRFPELEDETRHILGMKVVANLLAFIPEHSVFTALDVALDQIAEESVQLYTGMIGPGQTPAAKAAGRHI